MESIIAAVVLVIGLIGWSIADGILAGLKGLVSDAVKALGKKLAARIESLFGKRWKIIALASISVVAAPLCGVALYFNFNLHHIAPEQARKISDLVRIAAGRQASAMSPQECGELISAARGVANIDPRRLDQSASQALSQANTCSERIRASDTKLAMLIDAAEESPRAVLTLTVAQPLLQRLPVLMRSTTTVLKILTNERLRPPALAVLYFKKATGGWIRSVNEPRQSIW